jgi:hypothetical protein
MGPNPTSIIFVKINNYAISLCIRMRIIRIKCPENCDPIPHVTDKIEFSNTRKMRHKDRIKSPLF